MLKRLDLLGDIKVSMTRFPIVALLGPRQSGKTTLAREIAASHGIHSGQTLNYFDLESPTSLNRINEPQLALDSLKVKKVQIIYPGNETYELSKQVVALGQKDAFAKDS